MATLLENASISDTGYARWQQRVIITYFFKCYITVQSSSSGRVSGSRSEKLTVFPSLCLSRSIRCLEEKNK